jgi:anaerobic ribonucleoside-triphosphate reductase
LQGLNLHLSSSMAAHYWLHTIYPAEVRDAHIKGDLHLHDLGMLSVYCCGWDLQDLLLRGFGGVPGKIDSTPARHFRAALGQIVNFFYTLQGEAAGAVALSNFDTLLAPFIRHDGLDYVSVKQALQEFIFNMNVPTRVGFQTPFTNLTLDLTPSAAFRDMPIIIGGEIGAECYGDFQAEMDMLNRAFAEIMAAGDAQGRVFTFPIPTYNITADFDWETPQLEPIWAMTTRYGIPHFANFINSDMNPEDARSMCCRLRLDNRELQKRLGGLFAAAPLTGSVGVVTLNLPRLAYQAHTEADFQTQLQRRMEIARTSLEIKRKTIERFTEQGLFPYSSYYLQGIRQRTNHYWTNHFSTIGLTGMNEACLNLLSVDIGHPDGKAFAARTLQFMQDCLLTFQQETENLYNLEATPAESAAFRLARADKREFPTIITAGTAETPYYTNSSHLPVGFTGDIFAALEHQDDLQSLYTGGTVLHVFLGEQLEDWHQTRRLVKTIAENFRLPYFTLSPTFSVCPVHGYIAGEHAYCPHNHHDEEIARFGVRRNGNGTKGAMPTDEKLIPCEVYSRVVGYLRPVQQWNEGKKQEFQERTTYSAQIRTKDME